MTPLGRCRVTLNGDWIAEDEGCLSLPLGAGILILVWPGDDAWEAEVVSDDLQILGWSPQPPEALLRAVRSWIERLEMRCSELLDTEG